MGRTLLVLGEQEVQCGSGAAGERVHSEPTSLGSCGDSEGDKVEDIERIFWGFTMDSVGILGKGKSHGDCLGNQ